MATLALSSRMKSEWRFILTVLFLATIFATGGGSRSDIQSLVVLQPLVILVLALSLWNFNSQGLRQFKFLFIVAFALIALSLLHLIPLPPSMWQALPGRELIVQADILTEAGRVWRPLSMVPSATWTAFYSLLTPLTALLLCATMTEEQRQRLLPILIFVGLLSGFIGLLQAIGPPDGTFYFYRITNNGSAVGLFSNRNHQAVLLACIFPALAVYSSANIRTPEQAKTRSLVALAIGSLLIPLILVTGSRAGLVVGLLGLVLALAIYRRPSPQQRKKRKTRRLDPRILIVMIGLLTLGLLTILLARAEAFDRLSMSGETDELRFKIWGPILEMSLKYFPFGSGVGSFVEVFQIDEPDHLLLPQYLNHAHNDWLEVLLTAGLPGLLLLLLVAAAFLRTAWLSRTTRGKMASRTAYNRLGCSIIAMLGVASVFDYPLRTPSLMCVFVIAAIWAADNSAIASKRLTRHRSVV